MKTTIEIDDRLFERARREALRLGMTMKAFVNAAIQASLVPRTKKAEVFDLEFPVVHSTRAPSVDVADRRSLYDVMENR